MTQDQQLKKELTKTKISKMNQGSQILKRSCQVVHGCQSLGMVCVQGLGPFQKDGVCHGMSPAGMATYFQQHCHVVHGGQSLLRFEALKRALGVLGPIIVRHLSNE